MKGLIIAGGNGKRMGEKTNTENKCMLKINNKRLIEYSLDEAFKYVDEIIIVVGYLAGRIIETYLEKYKGKKIRYVFQEKRKGLVHAIQCAKKYINDDNFMLFLGDEIIINPKHGTMLQKYKFETPFCICGMTNVSDQSLIKNTYSIQTSIDGIVLKLVEKPDKSFNSLMGTGNCIISNRFFNYIDKTLANEKFNEIIFTDVLQTAVNNGEIIKWQIIGENYFNINTESDWIRASNYLKKK